MEQYITEIGDELRASADNGYARYDGRWLTLAAWVDAVVEQEARQFGQRLWEYLNDIVAYEMPDDDDDDDDGDDDDTTPDPNCPMCHGTGIGPNGEDACLFCNVGPA